MTTHQYTARQLRSAANVTSATYDQWRARGFIKSEQKAEGSGNPQLYSFDEVFRAAVLARLVCMGVSVSVADMHLDHLYGFKDSRAYLLIRAYDEAGASIEHTGTVGKIIRGEENLLPNVTECEGVVVISLNKIEARVKRALNS